MRKRTLIQSNQQTSWPITPFTKLDFHEHRGELRRLPWYVCLKAMDAQLLGTLLALWLQGSAAAAAAAQLPEALLAGGVRHRELLGSDRCWVTEATGDCGFRRCAFSFPMN